MKITDIEKCDWVGLAYRESYVRQIDYFSSPDGWEIGFEIVYRLHFSTHERALDSGGKLDGLKQAFKSAFGLADNHSRLDKIGHVTGATVYWRIFWDREAFDLKLLEKCEEKLSKFAEQNGVSIVVLEATIIPRSLESISQSVSMSSS